MKKLLFSALLCPIFIICSCQKEEVLPQKTFESKAIIYGLDEALCACCGNWIIEIDKNDNRVQFLELPQDANIDLQNTSFPISVKLNWRVDDVSPCQFIIIDDIELD